MPRPRSSVGSSSVACTAGALDLPLLVFWVEAANVVAEQEEPRRFVGWGRFPIRVVAIFHDLEDLRPAEYAGDASLVEELTNVAARRRTLLSLNDTVALLRAPDESTKRRVATRADDRHDGRHEPQWRDGKDEIVDPRRALAQVLLGNGIAKQGKQRAQVAGEIIGEVIEAAGRHNGEPSLRDRWRLGSYECEL